MTIAISTMWSAAYDRLDRFVADARALGFDRVELNYRLDPAALADILDCDELAVSSVHAPCPDVPTDAGPARLLSISSRDETIRQLAVETTLTSFATAADTGAAAVIVHCGGIAMDTEMGAQLHRMYADGRSGTAAYERLKGRIAAAREAAAPPYREAARKSIAALADEARRRGILLALENRFHYHEIPGLDEMEEILREYDPATVGYWHDLGHAEVRSRLGFTPHHQWFRRLGDRLAGIHVHDIRGLQDHLPPGTGEMDWDVLARALPPSAIRVCEIGEWNDPAAVGNVVAFLEKKGVAGPAP